MEGGALLSISQSEGLSYVLLDHSILNIILYCII